MCVFLNVIVQFQMNNTEVDRLFSNAGVKFGILSNFWVKDKESLLFYGDAGRFTEEHDDEYIDLIKDDKAVAGKSDNLTFENLVERDEVIKEKVFEKEEEDDNEKINPRNCPYCGEVKHRKSINRHIRMVHLTTKLECNQCGLQLVSKEKLEIHISKVHEMANEMTQCSFCEKIFDGKEKTNFHETMKHRGEVANDFKCENCEKSYKTRANMQRHTRTFH